MAETEKTRGFTTVYEEKGAGALAFATREDLGGEVEAYLGVIAQLKKDYGDQPDLVAGFHRVELQLKALRISTDSAEQVAAQLAKLIEIPIAEGKSLRLDAFRKTASRPAPETDEEYRKHLRKLVRNTIGNLTHLLLTWPEDTILQHFLQELQGMDLNQEARELRGYMMRISKKPQLWHYNEKKKEFLLEWLRPFQQEFGKPLEELSEQELQAIVQQVEELRGRKLEEMTHLTLDDDRGAFRRYNQAMHPIMNGKTTDFWGSGEVRGEFVEIASRLITRFSLTLEDRFLLFKSKDGGFAYLVGFADDAFDDVVDLPGGKLGIFPHLKVFLKGMDGNYAEIQQQAYGKNSSAYYRALKTAVVPFLTAMAVMLEVVLSDDLKQAFDMWT